MISDVTNCSAGGVAAFGRCPACPGRATGSSVPCLCHAPRAAPPPPPPPRFPRRGWGAQGGSRPGPRPAAAGRRGLPVDPGGSPGTAASLRWTPAAALSSGGKDSAWRKCHTCDPIHPPHQAPPRHDAPGPRHPMKQRIKRILAWGLFSLAMLVGSGMLLADHLMPPATGLPGFALPVQPGQTELDRELEPLLARPPGKTGAILLPDGLDAFAARALSARKAGRSLDLQHYIWHDDLTGHLLMHEAWKAAERGVRVRMLLDDINTSGKDASLLALDAHPNIEIRVYNPFRNREGLGRLVEMVQRMFSITYRMHNKAWIADNRVAIVGGRDVGPEYADADGETNFRVLDVLLFGPEVEQASAIFDTFWNSDAVVPIDRLNSKPRQKLDTVLTAIKEEARGRL